MSEPGKPPDFSNLSENLSQQQAKITALKELVRQSESQHGRNTASAQEKVKNIAQRLSNLKAKSSKSRHQRSSSEVSDYEISNIEEEEMQTPETSLRSTRSETPGSEKITMLRKQMELNRVKMAERESRSKEIEQMVTQLKSKFETSQMSLEKSVELGRSVGDLSLSSSSILHPQHRSSTFSDVSHTRMNVNFDNERIKFLESRVHELENEKDHQFTESDKIQSLERKILDLEENLKEKESIIEARTKAVSLLSENLTKKKKDVVDSLEETKQEMFKMQEVFLDAEASYKVEVDRLNRIIKAKSDETQNLNEKVEILEKSRYDLTIENSELKTKLEDVKDYSTKITELNKINETLQKQIANLESQRYEFINEDDVAESETQEGEKRANQDEILEKLKSLEEQLRQKSSEMEELEEKLQEKTVELNVVNANLAVLQDKFNAKMTKSTFDMYDEDESQSQADAAKFKQQLDEANKAAIKDKLKIKQLQKQVDSFKKGDANKEIARLTDEVQKLQQTITGMEEQSKTEGWDNWGGDETPSEPPSESENKIQVLETTCRNQIEAIKILEEQKMEMMEKIESFKCEESTSSGNLQEKIIELENLNAELDENIKKLTEEKKSLDEKLARYVSQNSVLLDKIEKLSKGSSAESIEMVTLTAQDSEEYQKTLLDEVTTEISEELNESLRSLREESSELMSKIELFTIERREVLDKLDAVTIENQVLVSSIETLRTEKVDLEHENECLKENVERNEKLISDLQCEKDDLSKKVSDLNDHRSKLQEEINKLVKQSLDSTSPKDSPIKSVPTESEPKPSTSAGVDKDACEKLLKQLDNEIQNLNKNKDKHQKLKISKKLSDNAKNVHAMMTNLLVDYFKTYEECQQLKSDLENVKTLMSAVTSSETDDTQLADLTNKLAAKTQEFEDLKVKFCEMDENQSSGTKDEMDNLRLKLETLGAELEEKAEASVKLQDFIDNLTMERDRCEIEVRNQKTLANEMRSEFDKLCSDVKVNNQKLNEKSQELDQLQREFDMKLKTSTSEVEILKTLVAEQKQLLIDAYQEHELDINQKVSELEKYKEQVAEMEKELNVLRLRNDDSQESYVNDLKVEIEKLKELLRENEKMLDEHKEELLHKQETIDTLNNQIIDLYKTMEENANRIIEKEDEIQYLQEINDTNRDEIRKLHQRLDESAKNIKDLELQLDNAISTPREPVTDANSAARIKQLEAENQKLETKNKENVDKLKKFAANLKKKQAQVAELEQKTANTQQLELQPDTSVVDDLKSQIAKYVEKLQAEESKCDEMEKNIFDYEVKLRDLENEKKNLKDSKNQLEKNLFDYEARIQELEGPVTKLKEMSQEFENLRKENEGLKEKINSQSTQQPEKSEDKKKMEKLKATAVQLKHKLTDKKKEVEELTQQIEALKSSQASSDECENLRKQLNELHSESERKFVEMKNVLEQEIAQLRQKIETSNQLMNEDNQRKLSLEGQLETFEMTTTQLRERTAHLEENLGIIESERNSLLQEKFALAKELEEKVNSHAEKISEFEYIEKAFIEQEAMVGNQLKDVEADNANLNRMIEELSNERSNLLQKLQQIDVQLKSSSEINSQQIINMENDNSMLQQQIQQLQNEIKKQETSHEQAMAAKHSEIDEMEADLSSQLQRIEAEKKTIQEALEKANDQIVDFQDEVVRLKDSTHSLEQARADLEREFSWLKLQSENYTQDQLEIEQLRMQLMQSETEAENLRSQNDNLLENHNVEITILRQQISDLETMRSQVSQNQTDDQVMLENENIRLKELLSEKENEITQKNLQLQMTQTSSLFESPVQAVNDPFASLAFAPPTQSQPQPQSTSSENLQEVEKLRESLTVANMELDMQSSRVQELQHDNQQLSAKIHEMQSIMDNLIKNNVELEASLETREKEIDEIKSELKNLRENLNRSTDDEKTHVLESEIDNIQGIVERFDAATRPPPSTSMFFSDDAPAASSLFDDPFIQLPQQQQQEVVEEIIQPRSAYLCYDQNQTVETQTDVDWLSLKENEIRELQVQIQNLQINIQEQSVFIESQNQNVQRFSDRIHELEESLELSRNSQQVQQVEIQQLQNRLVQPALEQPQAASLQNYFDTPPQQSISSQLAALEIEDGWGWGSNEAQETATVPQSSLLSPRAEVEVRLQEQKDINERLEQEKNALSDELTNSKENGKKMMKKLKEYQAKIKDMESTSFRKSSSVDSDMDQVIQEELNSQIQKLEAKLKELNGERQKELEEREGLVKKIEVLTSANERMLEMKERQDSQMELCQLKIRDLNQKLNNFESWGNEEENKKENTQSLPTDENQSGKVAELTAQIKDLQVDFDEVQALLDEEKNNNKRLEEKISKMSDSSDVERLTAQLQDLTTHRDKIAKESSYKDEQINELVSKIDMLSNESSNIRTILEDLSSQIQQKTNENHELNERLQNLARSNEELSKERQYVNDSIEVNFRQHADELEQQLQQLNAELQYKNSHIEELKHKIEILSTESDQTQSLIEAASAKDRELNSLRSQIYELENREIPSSSNMNANQLEELEKTNKDLREEKAQMEHELQVLNDQVLVSLEFEDKMKNTILELDAKNIEIQMLKASLEKVQSGSSNNDGNLDLLNAQWSQAVEQRGNEVANSWKQHLEMREAEFAEIESNLRNQLEQLSSSNPPIMTQPTPTAVDSATMEKMQTIMETQELEIVSLKEQLAIRSAEYASLAARVDPYRQMNVSAIPQPSTETDKVPRSELDLALYMLHQRDMRLEEMTMELVRLLEERDQLQLRLSNSIRQSEEIRRKFNVQDGESSDNSKTATPEKAPATQVEDDQLKAKLTELNSIRHMRDKAIQDEREQRFIDSISMLQRDVEHLPNEAAARIVGSSEGQSPSTVLMNWIMGNKSDSN